MLAQEGHKFAGELMGEAQLSDPSSGYSSSDDGVGASRFMSPPTDVLAREDSVRPLYIWHDSCIMQRSNVRCDMHLCTIP